MQEHYTQEDVFVGVDYHQHDLQVCVLSGQGEVLANRSVANSWLAVRAIAGRYGRVSRLAMESGCGASDLAEELIECTGWVVQLAHPGYVARMKGSPDKTDFSDAHLLADLTRVGYLPRVWLASQWVRELRRLVRYRQQQVAIRRNIKLRIRALLRDHRLRPGKGVSAWTRIWWSWINQEVLPNLPEASQWILSQHVEDLSAIVDKISTVARRLSSYTQEDGLTARLKGLAGVGDVTAWVIRAEIGRFDRFDRGKSLARFCGLSPRNRSSGQRQADAGLIKAGSKLLRTTLIELSHRLCRTEGRWRVMKQRLVASGKPGSVATAAVANRWVRKLYYLMKESGDVVDSRSVLDGGELGARLG